MNTRLIGLSVGVFLLAGPCAHADPATSFSELKGLVRSGETLRVQDTGGTSWTGALVEVTDSAIVLGALGVRREFDGSVVRRIEKNRDGVRNGIIWGALVGLLATQGCPRPRSPCVVGGIAFWGGIGALLDRAHRGWTLVYEAPVSP